MSSYDLVTHFFSILNNIPLSGCACMCFRGFSHVWLLDILWTVVHQILSVEPLMMTYDMEPIFTCLFTNSTSSLGSIHSELSVQLNSVTESDSLRPHELQHARPPCPSPPPGVHSNSCPSSQWCHPAISSSVVPFSSCPQSLPASESFPMSQLFSSDGQSIGVSALASFLPKNTQDWSL